MRRRLHGKQRPVGVTAFARSAQAKAERKAAEAQEAHTRMRAAEKQAAVGLTTFARTAKAKVAAALANAERKAAEAQEAQTRMRAAEEQAAEEKAIAECATMFANTLYDRCWQIIGPDGDIRRIGPPFLGGF